MVDHKLEEMLWAEYERITRTQKMPSLSALPPLADNSAPEVKPIAKSQASDVFLTSAKAQPQAAPQESTGGSGVGSKIESGALDFGKSRLKAMPLISTIVNLFSGGGNPAPPPPLIKYAMPPSIHIAAANSRDGGGLPSLDYGQEGQARAFSPAARENSTQSSSATAAQITVNVQAMDSRSFMDHSQEIAQAVREAMLNMHSLNDVVSEL
jgi:hypothetical protein